MERVRPLATLLLDGPGPITAASFGNEQAVWQLTDTGLAVNDDGKLSFALPVFEQHFGAQALREGQADLESAAGAALFPRWRYALANAVSISMPGEAEDYLRRVAQTNPGALSWLVDEIASDDRARLDGGQTPALWSRPTANDGDGDPAVLRGRWLRNAYGALLGGFGPFGVDVARHRDGQLVQWGVSEADGGIWLGEASDALPPPDVVRVPDGYHEITLASGWHATPTSRSPPGLR